MITQKPELCTVWWKRPNLRGNSVQVSETYCLAAPVYCHSTEMLVVPYIVIVNAIAIVQCTLSNWIDTEPGT